MPEAIDPSVYQERLDRIGEIFSSMMVTVEDLTTRPRARTRIASTSARPSSAAATSGSPRIRRTEGLRRGRQDRLPQCLGYRLALLLPVGCAAGRPGRSSTTRGRTPSLSPRRVGGRVAAASASWRCAKEPSTSRRRPRRSRSCVDRTGSRARLSCSTPSHRHVLHPGTPAPHRRPRARAAYDSHRPRGARRRRHRPLRRHVRRPPPRGHVRHRDRRRHDHHRTRARRPRRRARASRSSRSRTRSASAAATS